MNIPLNPHDLLFVLAPGAIAILTRPAWSANLKFMVALLICFLAALAEELLTGQASLTHFSLAAVKAFTLTFSVYAGLWKPLLPKQLEFLETQVNGGKAAAGA